MLQVVCAMALLEITGQVGPNDSHVPKHNSYHYQANDRTQGDSNTAIPLQTVEIINIAKPKEFKKDKLSSQEAFDHSGQPLARQLLALPGLTVFSAGGQLAKPMVNGLHSQRILILQDGVRLESQAWGSDHAPEIDPFQEGEWNLLQAAASLRHGPEALGGVLDQQAAPLLQHGHWDTHASSVWMSNNALFGQHLRVQGPVDRQGLWQIRGQGSSRISGNYRIPGAYLANTGNREYSGTVELQYNHNKWLIHNYLRFFYLRQGLYPGAHVDNADDLRHALNSPLPLWQGSAGYKMDRPMQQVRHAQYSLRIQRGHSSGGLSSLRYGYQDNQREEFDARSFLNFPEMALTLGTHHGSYTYAHTIRRWRLEGAAGLMFQQNLNQKANARQFIRNYQSLNPWIYSMTSWEHTPWGRHEWALRYDLIGFTSYYRPPGTGVAEPAIRDSRLFHRWSAAWTWSLPIPETAWNLRVNAGNGWRPPSSNELYANGLHQGMAALERGNPALIPEQTLLFNLGGEWKRKGLEFQSQAGIRRIRDYIFLEPLRPEAFTINGVYPQFAFVGRDVTISHWNCNLSQQLGSGWKVNLAAALVRGRESGQGNWLVWMPADRWSLGLHHVPHSITPNAGPANGWKRIRGGMEIHHVARQSRLPLDRDNQQILDYAPAPPAYSLLRIYAGGQMSGQHLQWMVSVDNALNAHYRDYMNRLRYFADEPGLNLSLRLQYHFHRHSSS
jgi:iron complex outermembrane receptor protein